MDDHGYVMGLMSFLMVLPAITLLMVFLDMTNGGINENSRVIESGVVLNTAKDFEADIVVTGKQVIQSRAENVVNSGVPLQNSRATLRSDLQNKMDNIAENYEENNRVQVSCNITSVDNSEDPFAVQVNSTVYVSKDSITHLENVSQEVSLIDPQYSIPDPLPFIKCRTFGRAQAVNGRVIFGESLADYLRLRMVTNASVYENATSPLIIKKCPYDPYTLHGTGNYNTLKNCIDNGYFHESDDGPCFLCRLEGKGTCPHYGFETYIVPPRPNSTNQTSAPSSIDHVVFNDTSPASGTYSGWRIVYYKDGVNNFTIYLDNAHRLKYGFPMV